MLINDLLTTHNGWKATHRGFKFAKGTAVWNAVERTNKGRIRVTRAVQGSTWGHRIIQRYVKADQAVVLVPLMV